MGEGKWVDIWSLGWILKRLYSLLVGFKSTLIQISSPYWKQILKRTLKKSKKFEGAGFAFKRGEKEFLKRVFSSSRK